MASKKLKISKTVPAGREINVPADVQDEAVVVGFSLHWHNEFRTPPGLPSGTVNVLIPSEVHGEEVTVGVALTQDEVDRALAGPVNALQQQFAHGIAGADSVLDRAITETAIQTP